MSKSKVYSCTNLLGYQAEERAKEILDRLKPESTNTPLLSLEESSRKVLMSETIQELTLKLVAEMHKDGKKGLVAMDSYGYPIKLISKEDTLVKLREVYLSPKEANTWLKKAGYHNGWKPNNPNIRQRGGDWKVTARELADECFDADTKAGVRDSLNGYSERVMKKMQELDIRGPRGTITNPLTIMRDALQANQWWANKKKC